MAKLNEDSTVGGKQIETVDGAQKKIEEHVTASEKETWNAKQDALNDNQIRPIYVQAEEPENPEENAIWIEIE